MEGRAPQALEAWRIVAQVHGVAELRPPYFFKAQTLTEYPCNT